MLDTVSITDTILSKLEKLDSNYKLALLGLGFNGVSVMNGRLSGVYVVKLKGRTHSLLSLTSQLGFIIQRDHKLRAVVYVNSVIVHGWIKIKQVVNQVNDR